MSLCLPTTSYSRAADRERLLHCNTCEAHCPPAGHVSVLYRANMSSAAPPQNCPALPLHGVLQPYRTPNRMAVGSSVPNQQRLPCEGAVQSTGAGQSAVMLLQATVKPSSLSTRCDTS